MIIIRAVLGLLTVIPLMLVPMTLYTLVGLAGPVEALMTTIPLPSGGVTFDENGTPVLDGFKLCAESYKLESEASDPLAKFTVTVTVKRPQVEKGSKMPRQTPSGGNQG